MIKIDAGAFAAAGPSPQTFSGLSAVSHTVTVKDANGCTKSDSITVNQPAAVTLSLTKTDVSCNGGSDGSVTATFGGGTGPYTASIDGGAFAAATSPKTFSSLSAGSHSVTVKDANGCTKSDSITVNQSSAVTLSLTKADVSCNGGSDGSVTATFGGGTAPYMIKLDAGAFAAAGASPQTFSGLSAGSHTVTVKDANGCTASKTITITEPTKLVASSSATPILCNGGDSTVTVSASGGAAPYTGTGTFTKKAGTYTFNVTDANGCTASTTVTITEPTKLVASSSATPILCNGGDSTVTVSASGGAAPYTGTGTFTKKAGTYTFNVTDANGCTASTTVTITEPTKLVASSSATPILCNGGDSTVTVSASGGTAPYTGTGTFTKKAGTYTFNVTDANGCTASTTVTITAPTKLVASSSATPILCNGGDSTVTFSASGGAAPYTTPRTSTQKAGTYTFNVTDANGCTASTTVTITEPTVLTASSSATPILCNGGSSTVTVSASGGTAPYTGTGMFSRTAGT